MKRFSAFLVAAGLALVVTGQARASGADEVCTFSYTSNMVPGVVPSDAALGSINETSGGSGVGLDADLLPSGTDIVLTNLDTSSAALDTFGVVSFFDIFVTLTDRLGNPEAFSLSGKFTGSLTPNAAQIGTTILGQSYTTSTLVDVFTVKVTSFVPPGPPASPTPGSIGATVTCHPVVPEPTTMALLGLGLLPMAAVIRRRRK